MQLDLDGRVALVTGAAAGIGAAIARGLAAEGCDVAIVDRTAAAAQVTAAAVVAAGRRALVLEADVRDGEAAHAAVARCVADLGRLDILVCNAGITADSSLIKMTDAQWDDVLAVNLRGCFTYTRAAAALFKQQRSGRIVTVSSINGLRGKFAQANYAASKAGVIALTKTVARELGAYGVTANVVAPGMVLTDMARALPAEYLDKAVAETVLGRLAAPEDCADAVVFLCSSRARHITGHVLQVDGGQYI